MGTKMKNAPIYFAIVQVRFNALLQINTYVPKAQDALRKLGFPDYGQTASTTLRPGAGNEPPTIEQQLRYEFMDAKRGSGFTLDHRALSFQTTHYETLEPFLSHLLSALAIVNEIAGGLAFSERVGMRMLDAVRPKPDETMGQYLKSSVLGLVDSLPNRQLAQSYCETVTRSGTTTLVSRALTTQQNGGPVAYPPDLAQMASLTLPEKFTSVSGLYSIVDTDCWHEGREDFSLDNIQAKVHLLHDELDRSFKATVTQHALDTWK